MILPLDGFAFWVKADILNPSAILNTSALNLWSPNQAPTLAKPALTEAVKGSLHYTTANNQDEAEGFAVNRIIFTSETEVELLNTLNPQSMVIGEFDGLRFAFSRRTMLYRQAGLFHYQGDAIYPAMETQIVDSFESLDLSDAVVSNSLPIWLTLNKFAPVYPSYLVPDNIQPPWISVHIEPGLTQAMQSAPLIDPTNGSHYQLARDRVRLTFYGLRNSAALDFQDYLLDYSLNTDALGIMNMPVVRDEKRTQAELNILAMKKSMEVDVSYYQSRVRDEALQYIRSAFITFYPQGGVEVHPAGLQFNSASNSLWLALASGI